MAGPCGSRRRPNAHRSRESAGPSGSKGAGQVGSRLSGCRRAAARRRTAPVRSGQEISLKIDPKRRPGRPSAHDEDAIAYRERHVRPLLAQTQQVRRETGVSATRASQSSTPSGFDLTPSATEKRTASGTSSSGPEQHRAGAREKSSGGGLDVAKAVADYNTHVASRSRPPAGLRMSSRDAGTGQRLGPGVLGKSLPSGGHRRWLDGPRIETCSHV